MVFNIVVGFVVPWILGGYLFKKDAQIVLIVSPFASVVAFTVNELGFYMNFWHLQPYFDEEGVSALPYNLGLYPVLSCWFIYFIRRKIIKPVSQIMIFTLITTLLEGIMLLMGKAEYENGWHIYWTFMSYLLLYIPVYWYYIYLKKAHIFNQDHEI
jgi:hypothetical protein